MKRRGCLRRRIEKRSGKAEWACGLFFLLFLTILLCAQLQLSLYRSSSMYLEDALAASNLASAVIDVEEYGISHRVRIRDPWEAYRLYLEAVRGNLNLDENWECPNKSLISGKVSVTDYIIYNVTGEDILVFHINEEGEAREALYRAGEVKAPDGSRIEHTSIYSAISFPVEGFLGVSAKAHKGKLVDIVADWGP